MFLFSCEDSFTLEQTQANQGVSDAVGSEDSPSAQTFDLCAQRLIDRLPKSSEDSAYTHNVTTNGFLKLGRTDDGPFLPQTVGTQCTAIAETVQASLIPLLSKKIDHVEYYGCQCASDLCENVPASQQDKREYNAHLSNGPTNGPSNPYLIFNGYQLEDIAHNALALKASYLQCNDIDLRDIYSPDYPYFVIGSSRHTFSGTYDGGGYQISGFTYVTNGRDEDLYQGPLIQDETYPFLLRQSENHVALFGFLNEALVQNLELSDVNINVSNISTFRIAGLAGYSKNSVIREVSVQGRVHNRSDNLYTGGLVGEVYGALTGSGPLSVINSVETHVEVIGGIGVGGLVGSSDLDDTSAIIHAKTYGNVSGQKYVGGLIGNFEGRSVSDSSASGNISGSIFSGGLIGHVQVRDNSPGKTRIENCFATGDVSSGSNVGGLIGKVSIGPQVERYAVVLHSQATGTIKADSLAGGLIGSIVNTEIKDTYATGNVLCKEVAGGLIAWMLSSSIDNSYASGDVSGVEAGGLVGVMYSSLVKHSYAQGSITNDAANPDSFAAGGMVGLMKKGSTIHSSFAEGNVTGKYQTGGFVGEMYESTISNSYSIGQISVDDFEKFNNQYAGGFAGRVHGQSSVENVYAAGDVLLVGEPTLQSFMGGLVGSVIGSQVYNSFAAQDRILGNASAGFVFGDDDSGSTINNTHYWSGVQCSAASPCEARNGEEGHQLKKDFYDSSEEPLSSWNFSTIWLQNDNAFPSLR